LVPRLSQGDVKKRRLMPRCDVLAERMRGSRTMMEVTFSGRRHLGPRRGGWVHGLRPGDPERIGGYTLLGRIGSGAMGAVYLALSRGGRPIAVKVVRAELGDDPGFRERFRREVEAVRSVGGFWTAAVVDADLDAAQPWLATEYVPGPSLQEAVCSRGPLPVDAVRHLAAGLAEGLAAIHAAGVVHRDLKPANVLIGANGPRVIDFGISRALAGSTLTAAGHLLGTPGYLSPEQISGGPVGPASDVYALGGLLVFAATGRGRSTTWSVPACNGTPRSGRRRLVCSPRWAFPPRSAATRGHPRSTI